MLALSACTTGAEKAKAAAEAKPEPTAGEQLATALNEKAATKARKAGEYHDPLVRSMAGVPMQVADSQQPGAAPSPSAPPPLPGSAASAPVGIAGLATQPTAVNANRTSIYSTPAPPAIQLDGTLAAPAASQGITPMQRSVYSAPVMPPAVAPQPLDIAPPPTDQSSRNVAPAPTQQTVPVASAFHSGRPTADATPSRILPAPGSKARKLDSQEALMIARSLASKQQQGQNGKVSIQPGSAGAVLTPGMAASLKQPIAFRSGDMPPVANALYGGPDLRAGKLPAQFASLPASTRGSASGLELQNDQVQTGCFKPDLLSKLQSVETHFGRPVVVASGYRDPAHNHLVGGSRESLHTTCDAADIQVPGVSKATLASYLRSLPDRGGVGTYCHTESVHVDTGAPRDWNRGCDGA